MLSKTRQFSPARAATGLIGIGALSVAALAFTASGTSAAATLKEKVETVTGVALGQDMPAPPAPPAAAEAPEPAAAPEPPEAPEAAEGPNTVGRHVYRFSEDDKKNGKRVRKMVIVRADGSKDEIAMPDVDAIRASIPEIRDGKCGKGEGKPSVEHRQDGGKKIMIICTDRIEMAAADAERMAMRHKALGMDSARMGLRIARRSIESETHMSAAERATALKGIDEAMAELDKQRDED
jgi:hypothetical protein